MATKKLRVTLSIPRELGLSSESMDRLNKVFEAELSSILSATVKEAPAFMPLNTHPTSSKKASVPKKKSGK